MGAGAVAARRAAGLAVLFALLVVTTGCGAHWSDAQRASVIARYEAGGSGRSGSGTGSGGGDSTGTTLAGAATGAATGGTATGGTTGSSTGGGAGGSAGGASAAAGPRPCTAPSNAPGITKDSITVGSISTNSGPVPGLGLSQMGAVRAYVAYRNATGGVCGRKIVLNMADDADENTTFRSEITDMAPKVLGIAGGLAAGDGGGVDVVTSNKIPVVSTPVTDQFQDAPTVFDVNPPFANPRAVIGKYRWLVSQGVHTAALVTIAVAQSLTQMNLQKSLMEAAGIKIATYQQLPLSTLSYDAPARAVANSKADYLFFLGAGNLNSSMAKSMYDTGYKPKFSEYLTAYGSNFIDLAGTQAAEGTISSIRSVPNEEAGPIPEQNAFLQWMRRISPGIPPDTFAADGWAATKGFFDALEALPGPISREALIAQLKTMTRFDAGGLMGPINLGNKTTNGCVVEMQVVSGKWQRLYPAQGFLC
jgi:ABC-type branched-subunit amino acid transport system substrate-binding protein